jgi:hypothetical protein
VVAVQPHSSSFKGLIVQWSCQGLAYWQTTNCHSTDRALSAGGNFLALSELPARCAEFDGMVAV